MRIIAIDPGYERLGIAILDKNQNGEFLVFSECFKTSPSIPHNERLQGIKNKITSSIKEFLPKTLAIETLFFNKNVKTALKVAEARGIILGEAGSAGLPVFEYTPLQIKIAVAGYGRADKKQIISILPKLIRLDKQIENDDEYDAIAIGLTHFAVKKVR